MKRFKRFKRAYGLNEFGMINYPKKISGTKLSRILLGDESGCSFCFPHGFETFNSSSNNRQKSWKFLFKKRWVKRKKSSMWDITI